MNKKKILDLLSLIKNDIEYYKNKPNFIKLLEKNLKKEKILESIIDEYENNLSENTDYTVEIKNIENYIKKFEKKYIEKIEISDGIIYRYEKEYRYYPNKKSIHIQNFFKTKFLTDIFDSIIIDNIVRPEKKFTSSLIEDIKHAKSCFIIIKINE